MGDRFLSKLFELRGVFHAIAMQNMDDRNSSKTIVCWADVVIARLGQAAVIVAGTFFDVAPHDHGQPPSVRAQKDDDVLRAALQLPSE